MEEEASNRQTDLLTVCRENLSLVSILPVSSKWKIHGMDVKSAFLQGFPIECDVNVIPPPEANISNLCELRKTYSRTESCWLAKCTYWAKLILAYLLFTVSLLPYSYV